MSDISAGRATLPAACGRAADVCRMRRGCQAISINDSGNGLSLRRLFRRDACRVLRSGLGLVRPRHCLGPTLLTGRPRMLGEGVFKWWIPQRGCVVRDG